MAAVLPPFTLWSAARYPGALRGNLGVLITVVLIGSALVGATGDWAQWIGYGIGVYSVFSWTQMLRFTDPPSYALIWGSPTMLLTIAAFGSLSFFIYGYLFWVTPYGIRTFGVTKELAGLYIGLPSAVASAAGVIIGGRISDAWKLRDDRGRVFVCMLSVGLTVPFAMPMFSTHDFRTYSILSGVVYLLISLWPGSAIAAYQDLVLPRMRGTIGATYLLGATMFGLALGPYFVGKIATVSGSLRLGMYSLFVISPLSLLLLWMVSRRIGVAEAGKFARAEAAGELPALGEA